MRRSTLRGCLRLGAALLVGIVVQRVALLGLLLVAAVVLSFDGHEVEEFPAILPVAEGIALLLAVGAAVLTIRPTGRGRRNRPTDRRDAP